MTYNLAMGASGDFPPTIEEREVATAIKRAGYKRVFTGADSFELFTPTYILYREYRAFIAKARFRFDSNGEPSTNLSARMFGAALRGRFALTSDHRARHTVDGKRHWGYFGIVGPESVRVRHDAGRPPTESRYNDGL